MNLKAKKLFGKDDKGIEEHFTKVVKERLRSVSPKDREILEKMLMLKEGLLSALSENGRKLDIGLFDKISNALGISLFEAFGKPHWPEDETKKREALEYWRQKQKKEPIVPVAACGQDIESDQQEELVPLDVYVTFRAANELRTES